MAIWTTSFRIHSNKPLPTPTAQRKDQVLLRMVANWLMAALAGDAKVQGFDVQVNSEAGAKAATTVTFATSSGSVGITINGVTVTVTWASSDIASMTALVAAIGASVSALVQYLVEASNTRGTATLTSVAAGTVFNLGQYQFTAVNRAPVNYGEFDISGNDTADAASLAAAINNHPQVSRYYQAIAASGVCAIWRFATPPGSGLLSASASSIAVAAFAASAVGCVRSVERTRLANAITTAASGTNVTVGAARLTGGAGGNVVQRSGVA